MGFRWVVKGRSRFKKGDFHQKQKNESTPNTSFSKEISTIFFIFKKTADWTLLEEKRYKTKILVILILCVHDFLCLGTPSSKNDEVFCEFS